MALKPNKKGKLTGTKGNDKITWVNSKDWAKAITVNAGNGNDVINFKKSKYKNKLNGQNGNDTIYGGTNADTINGGNGNDRLYGYNGNDIIYGGNGNDQIWGGNGNDILFGNTGNNYIYGDAGNDTITGGTNNDVIYGGAGDDIIYGSAGNNTLSGDDGNDTLYGGANDDTIYGGSGNDIIYGNSGYNTLLGGDGNDTIYGGVNDDTIYGGTGADTIYSMNGNNTIYGEDGNDSIYLAAGSETVNAGTGSNRIYVGKNGGTDTIYNGSGVDTLVFSDEKSFGKISMKYSGTDLVLTTKNGNNVILKDFANGHSVKTLAFQNYNVAIDKLLPKHIITPAAAGKVNGTASDDIININAAGTYTIAPCEGNDTINLNGTAGAQKVTIDITAGNGDLSINNLITYTTASHSLKLTDNNDLLIRNMYGHDYIIGTRQGNSYEINLTNGENIRIDNYFNFSDATRRFISYKDTDLNYYKATDRLIRTNNITNLTAVDPNFNDNSEYSFIVAEGDENHNIVINSGRNNTVVTEGNGTDNITVDNITPLGKNNDVFVNGSGNKTITDKGYSSNIYVNNKDANATVYMYGDESILHTYAGTNTITTKIDDNNTIYVHTADDATEKATATITSLGGDYISTWGNVTVNFDNSSDVLDDPRSVNIMAKGLTTTVQNIHNLNPAKLNGGDVCFWFYEGLGAETFEYTHYSGDQYVNVYAKDGNGNRLDGVLKFDTLTGGGTFDSATTDDLIHLWNDNQDDWWLSSMDRYVDMARLTRLYEFGDASNGSFNNIKSRNYIVGTASASRDRYADYEVSGMGKNVIADQGGNNDLLEILENLGDVKLFMDIKADGTLASNDLYIFSATELSKHLKRQDKTDYLCIENFFGNGKIENVNINGITDYTLKNNSLLTNPSTQETSQLIADVQAWLTNANHSFDSVGAAIASGLSNSNAGTLAACFNKVTGTDAANYWQEIV